MTLKSMMLALASAGALLAASAPAQAQNARDLNGRWDNGDGVSFVDSSVDAKGNICVRYCGQTLSEEEKAKVAEVRRVNMPKYKPEFTAKVEELHKTQVTTDPALRCGNPGLPRIGMPDQIVQTKDRMFFLYDDLSGAFFRIIPTNTRKHREDADPSTFGDAVAWWEGDTLVVESINFDDSTWLTDNGAFHTDRMKVTERLQRKGQTLHWQATVEDPGVLAEPWKSNPRTAKFTTEDLLEAPPCVEQSIAKMPDLSDFHTNVR